MNLSKGNKPAKYMIHINHVKFLDFIILYHGEVQEKYDRPCGYYCRLKLASIEEYVFKREAAFYSY